MNSLVGNVVGARVKPQSAHPDRAVREPLQALWLRWTDHAAPDGLADFYGLQAMAVRAMARTVEVIWSTGAQVRRRDMVGQYIERLSVAPEAVALSRLEGASVLDAHRQTAVRDVLGSVRRATVDGKRGTALIQFSARPEVEPVWQDVLTGILRHVSVGYSVEEWAEATENGSRVPTAVRWTPHEISLVPRPADPGAHIRLETEMTDTTTNPAPIKAPTTNTRAEVSAEIRSIPRVAGLEQSWIDGQIDANADPDTARRAAFEALAKRSAPTIRTEPVRVDMGESQDDPALRARQMASIAPATAADVNPFSGSLSLEVEPRLSSGTRWCVTADPGEIDGLEFAYLSGAEGPQVESRSGWDVDGVEIRVILDFGAGFIDHRGWFMNAGA